MTITLDKSQRPEKHSSTDLLAHAGSPTYIDAEHAIAHNTVVLTDAPMLVTGSFTFPRAAQECRLHPRNIHSPQLRISGCNLHCHQPSIRLPEKLDSRGNA